MFYSLFGSKSSGKEPSFVRRNFFHNNFLRVFHTCFFNMEEKKLVRAYTTHQPQTTPQSVVFRIISLMFFLNLCLLPSDRYCIEFEVIKATKACHKDPVYKQLEVGERVVVKCDLEAFLPQDDKDDNSTINDSQHDNKNLENETIEDFKQIKITSKTKSKYRCRGEGSTGRNTRFSAMAIPSCHGKWMKLTVGQPKKCSYQDSQFIFV